ncbi:MAG TPA: hypothetical protein VHF69_11495 [Candidatus Synoicihabitans sp.]|nr:hypothetical protein [Candidatus Synoicihabitans sp.]
MMPIRELPENIRRFQRCGFLLGLMLVAGGLAADEPVMSFVRLDLNDGRTLQNVVVKSYDAKSEKVLVVADGKALTVPVALVPPPFDRQLRAVRPSGESMSVVPGGPLPPATQTPVARPTAARSAPSNGRTTIVSPRSPRPAPRPTLVQSTGRATRHPTGSSTSYTRPAAPDVGVAQHAAAARDRANRYYRFEPRVGSGSISVTALNIQLDSTTPIPGWTGRYRSQGRADLEYWDSKGRSVQRRSSTFEVETQEKDGSVIVADFTRKT